MESSDYLAYNGSDSSGCSTYSLSSFSADSELYCPYSTNETQSTSFFDRYSLHADNLDNNESSSTQIKVDPFLWNNRFQDSIAEVRKLETTPVTHTQRQRIWTKLSSLSSDFIHAAKTYGKIIISEAYLPAEQKTIKPLSGRGIAGGEKYIIHSIMFKFAIDSSNLFGGDDQKASRVAGHDLLGLNCYLSCGIDALNTPLVCLLDYRGFRLVALSLLPITRDTLIYGSDDAGKNVLVNSEIHSLLLEAASQLNIREHDVVELKTKTLKKVATAIDVEAHKSKIDGRTYIVDCSRAMPPSAVCKDPRYRGSCNHLTMLLRPELVKYYSKPLCNDTYSSILLPKSIVAQHMQSESKKNEFKNGFVNQNSQFGQQGYQNDNDQESCTQNPKEQSSYSYDKIIEEDGYDITEINKNHDIEEIEEPLYQNQVQIDSSDSSNQTIPNGPNHAEFDIDHSDISFYKGAYSEVPDDRLSEVNRKDNIESDSFDSSPSQEPYLTYNQNFPDIFNADGTQIHPDVSENSNTSSTSTEDATLLYDHLYNLKLEYENDITDATNYLLLQVIPKFAIDLQKFISCLSITEQSIFAYDWLVVWLHWYGINIRHLGTLRASIKEENKTLRSLLLNIMLSRVLKNMSNHRLRIQMSKLKYAGEYPYQQTLVSFLNLVFGSSTESLIFWNTHLKLALLYQFPDALTEQERDIDLRVLVLDSPIVETFKKQTKESKIHENDSKTSMVDNHTSDQKNQSKHGSSNQKESEKAPVFELPVEPICFLFFSFCKLVGLKLKADHMNSFASNPNLFKVAEPLNVLDLDGAPEKTKTLQIVAHSQGLIWKVRAEAASSLPKSRLFATGLWKLSLNCYKESLLANPRDQRTLRNVAEIYHDLGFDALAGCFAHLAIASNKNDAVSMYKYAIFIFSTTKDEATATKYYEASLACPNVTPGAYLSYSQFKAKLKDYKGAEKLLTQCVETFPTSADAMHKMAHFLETVKQDYENAHIYYKKAIDLEPEDLTLLSHYTRFLKNIIKDEELSRSYELLKKKLEQKTTITGRGSKLWRKEL